MGVRRFKEGQKIGRLTVIGFLGTDTANKRLVSCKCECGVDITVRLNNLGRKTNSCGCLKADLIRKRMGKPIKDVCARHVLNACKRNAPTELSLEDVKRLIFSDCYYCEESKEKVGTIWRRGIPDGREVFRVGIDRINPSVGYTLNNCVPCCQVCNYIKRDHLPKNLKIRLNKFIKNLEKLINQEDQEDVQNIDGSFFHRWNEE